MSNIWNLKPEPTPQPVLEARQECLFPTVKVHERPNARIPGAIDLLLMKKYGVQPNNDEEE